VKAVQSHYLGNFRMENGYLWGCGKRSCIDKKITMGVE
jgi:hypothetical protein